MKNSIKLDENYSIIPDKYCWTLHYENVKQKVEDGKIKDCKTVDNWYYGSVKQALKSYVDKSLWDCGSIKDLIERLQVLEAKIDSHGLF